MARWIFISINKSKREVVTLRKELSLGELIENLWLHLGTISEDKMFSFLRTGRYLKPFRYAWTV